MKVAGRTHLMKNYSVVDSIRAFREMGYDGMELSLLRGMGSDFLVLDYTEDYVIDKVREVCAEARPFAISAVSCHSNFALSDSTLYGVKRLIPAAPKYGTNVLITSTFVPFAERDKRAEDLFLRLVQRTREVCALAEEHGVYIAIEVEPQQICHNLEIFMRLAEQVKSPALKINFDVGHFFISEPDIYKSIEDCREFIIHSHIDNMCRGEHFHKVPWEGEMDLVKVFRKLQSCGFDGFTALDIYEKDYAAIAPECARYIKNEIFTKLA